MIALELLILVPLAGVVACLVAGRFAPSFARVVALAATLGFAAALLSLAGEGIFTGQALDRKSVV